MKKFEVIEEGRMNTSEMIQIKGGYTCGVTGWFYSTSDNCGGGTTGKYSNCPSLYRSCTDNAYTNCIESYTGPTGPAGIIGTGGNILL